MGSSVPLIALITGDYKAELFTEYRRQTVEREFFRGRNGPEDGIRKTPVHAQTHADSLSLIYWQASRHRSIDIHLCK